MIAPRSLLPSPVLSGPDLLGLRMSAEDYFAIGETQERYELIDGVVLTSPSPRPRHFKVIQELLRQLDRFEESGGVVDVYSEIDIVSGADSVYRPDLCVYARRSPAPEAIPERLSGSPPPDLIVEVLSPGSQALDLVTKRDGYERMGVKEYWVINPADATVRVWRAEAGKLVGGGFADSESLASAAMAGFVLDINRLRGRVVG